MKLELLKIVYKRQTKMLMGKRCMGVERGVILSAWKEPTFLPWKSSEQEKAGNAPLLAPRKPTTRNSLAKKAEAEAAEKGKNTRGRRKNKWSYSLGWKYVFYRSVASSQPQGNILCRYNLYNTCEICC
jgi:hypothetical protein